MPVVSLAVLGGVGSVGYKLYYAPFTRHQALYAAGALVIYWFSVSGGWSREGYGAGCLDRAGWVWVAQFGEGLVSLGVSQLCHVLKWDRLP